MRKLTQNITQNLRKRKNKYTKAYWVMIYKTLKTKKFLDFYIIKKNSMCLCMFVGIKV